MARRVKKQGFTLIELALSMAVIAVLSISIALIVSDVVQAYRRGLTINRINTDGMDIVDDIQTAIQNSSAQSIIADCEKYYDKNNSSPTSSYHNCIGTLTTVGDTEVQSAGAGAYYFVSITKTSNVTIDSVVHTNVPIYGAFCTGTYSYIWNTGYYDAPNAEFREKTDDEWATFQETPADTLYKFSARNPERPFRLLKVRDDQRGVCKSVVRPYNGSEYGKDAAGNVVNYPVELDSEDDITGAFTMYGYGGTGGEAPVELIMVDDDVDLALYDFFVARPAESTLLNNYFYSMSFILGSVRGGVNILAQGRSCAAPNDYENENFDYCAINKFNFAAQTSGI